MVKLILVCIFLLFSSVISQSNNEQDLLSFAENGKVNDIKKILATGADPNWKNDDGQAALHVASIVNQVPIIRVLLGSGADINLQDDMGFTPLYTASVMAHSTDAVKTLINEGADINIPSDRGMTPLMSAASSGNWDNVRALIYGHANITLSSKDGSTALHWTVQTIEPERNIVRLLLYKGADTQKKTRYGATPGDMARDFGHPDIANIIDSFVPTPKPPISGLVLLNEVMIGNLADVKKTLATGTDPNWMEWRTPDDNIWTALHATSHYNRPAVASVLLEAGADKDLQDNLGRTALHVASQLNHPAVMSVLLDAGADKNLPDNYGLTPLYLASKDGGTDAAIMLIDHGVDIEFPNWLGRTALHAASEFNQLAVMTVLLDAGGNKDMQDNFGQTPLHRAAIKNSLDTARLLLQRGANKRLQDNKGWSPGKIARKLKYNDLAKIIKEF